MSTEALSTEVIEVDTLASAKPVEEEFAPFEAELVKLLETAGTIQVTDESQTKQMLLARQTRLAIRQVRITVEKTHKARKQYFLDGGRRIDAVKNRILALIEPAEERLRQLEDFAAIAQQKREEALRTERAEQLHQYEAPHVAADLGKLADDAWTMILSGAKAAHEAKIEAARKAEEERIAREKAETEERERVRQENERLRAEAERLEAERKAAEEQARRDREAAEAALRAEQERAAAEKAKLEAEAKAERERMESERRAVEEEARKQREAAEAAAKAERDRVEAERRAAEDAARKEREAIEAAAAAERAAAAAELARLQAQKDAAEKAERDRIAAEKAAAEAKAAEEAKAAAKAAAAPDAEKMRAYADALAAVPVPNFATEAAQTKGANIATAVAQLADRIRITADSL